MPAQTPAKQKIIIDTDPGQDDAVAILLALASPELDILGITAVAGNVPLKLTEKNARKICELAGKPETRVFAGASRPLMVTPDSFSEPPGSIWNRAGREKAISTAPAAGPRTVSGARRTSVRSTA